MASTPIARNPTLWVGVLLFLLVGAWASVLISIAGRTASAQEGLTEAHRIVATSGHISATWPHGRVTMGYQYPDTHTESVDEFEAKLDQLLNRWEPK